jgi:hypothetical protein
MEMIIDFAAAIGLCASIALIAWGAVLCLTERSDIWVATPID